MTEAPVALVLVAAVADNGVIGSHNGMPWRLKSEIRHFRAVTLGKPIVMGRKTFASIGRPLDRRTNIVVSRDQAFAAPGIVAVPTLATALTIARADARRRGADAVMVIGGADIYAQTLALADRILLTRVHLQPAGDTRFPAIDPGAWEEVERNAQPAGPGDDAAFTYLTLVRRHDIGATEGHVPAAPPPRHELAL